MHDIYPFILSRGNSEALWIRFCVENPTRAISWYEVDAIVQSPIHVEFAVYDSGFQDKFGTSRGDLVAEIGHNYSDTTLYPLINEQQLRIAGQVLAERERLAAARELEQKIAAVHLELFGELPCASTD
jgi:hypothetical protein